MYSTGGGNSLGVAGVTFRFHRRILFPVLLHSAPMFQRQMLVGSDRWKVVQSRTLVLTPTSPK